MYLSLLSSCILLCLKFKCILKSLPEILVLHSTADLHNKQKLESVVLYSSYSDGLFDSLDLLEKVYLQMLDQRFNSVPFLRPLVPAKDKFKIVFIKLQERRRIEYNARKQREVLYVASILVDSANGKFTGKRKMVHKSCSK